MKISSQQQSVILFQSVTALFMGPATRSYLYLLQNKWPTIKKQILSKYNVAYHCKFLGSYGKVLGCQKIRPISPEVDYLAWFCVLAADGEEKEQTNGRKRPRRKKVCFYLKILPINRVRKNSKHVFVMLFVLKSWGKPSEALAYTILKCTPFTRENIRHFFFFFFIGARAVVRFVSSLSTGHLFKTITQDDD